jgi:hypothetical protein
MILDTPPICKVKSCQEPCQLVSKKGDQRTYMKTCRRHNFMDLPDEREQLETFWPPSTK